MSKLSLAGDLCQQRWENFGAWGCRHISATRWGIFLLAVALFSSFASLEHWAVGRDATGYIALVTEGMEHNYLHFDGKSTPPLLLSLMAHFAYWFGVLPKVAGFLLVVSSGALSAVWVFSGIFRLFKDYNLALLGGLLYLLQPELCSVSVDVLRDAPSLAMNLGALYFFICFRQTGKRKFYFITWVMIVLALGFRFENIEFFIVIPGMNFYLNYLQKDVQQAFWQKQVRDLGVMFWGVVTGAILLLLICSNTNYFVVDRLPLILNRYSQGVL